jgi:hypothetical protein
MTGTIGKALGNAPTTPNGQGVTGTPASSGGPATSYRPPGEDQMALVPAGLVADLLGGLSGTIGEITGGFFGNRQLGKQIGDAASPLIKLLPFQMIPPAVAPMSGGGPAGTAAPEGPDEALIVVPAGFVGGLLGGIGGKLLGGVVGGWLGNESTGQTAGGVIGGVLGGLLPFQVVPPALMPQSAGPDGGAPQEPMVVVPAGFFGDLLGGFSGTLGGLIGGKTGQQIGTTAAPFLKLLPFQQVPPDMAPMSTGPGGTQETERLVVLPAGFFGSLLSGLAGTVGGAVGQIFGDAKTGQAVGNAAAPLLEMLPFHAVPDALVPASSDTGPGTGKDEKLMLVPAGLFGNLLSGYAGAIGGTIGGWLGDAKTGQTIGNAAAPLIKLLPFGTSYPAGYPAPSGY